MRSSILVSNEVKAIFTSKGLGVSVIPLHPQMINQNGNPDLERRAPHPALVFKVKP